MLRIRFPSRLLPLLLAGAGLWWAGCTAEDEDDRRDRVPPAAVSDLVAFAGAAPSTVRLEWTASGDDGTSGNAASYEVRVSSAVITPANYSAATVVAQAWTPLPPGSAEVRLVSGLTPGAHLYFALMVFDEAGNASPSSNCADVTVTVPDVTAPGAVSDLAASPGTAAGSVSLTWTAPGDDGAAGTCRGYEIRRSLAAIDGTNFDAATPCAHSLLPQAGGTPESLTVSGLVPGRTYHFALRATDEALNSSPVSNDASCAATAGSGVWSDLAPSDVPSARSSHTAVACGSEVVVWGGLDGSSHLADGARYLPGSHSWRAIASVGAPSARANHRAVWTGKEMIVWGGDDGTTFFQAGGRYSPNLDRWAPTSSVGAPSGRWFHTAVWTGSAMIVWGGQNKTQYFGDGARYDPSADVWQAMTSANAPSARLYHTAVWTGTHMIVFGGENLSACLAT
ncbi:MAG: hypothetical protein MUC63_04010, partial [Planctomycetes bacterium]|nr:hypothetical protein [Planctomycetota bacterium]